MADNVIESTGCEDCLFCVLVNRSIVCRVMGYVISAYSGKYDNAPGWCPLLDGNVIVRQTETKGG